MARWGRILQRGNVEDRRSFRSVGSLGGLGLGGIALIVAINYLMGGDLSDVLNQLETAPTETQTQFTDEQFAGADSYEVFASTVLGSNNAWWSEKLAEQNKTYTPPRLVLFRDYTDSACGGAFSQIGPHYCPADQTIYLDERFFDQLQAEFGAEGGDVAEAYVMAHEVGHHVQELLNTSDGVTTNEESIKLELQADCYAGLWAYSLKDRGIFEFNEIKEAIDAAAAVGDDRIQEKIDGRISPENWTHGSSEQRVSWFNRGFITGIFSACDNP